MTPRRGGPKGRCHAALRNPSASDPLRISTAGRKPAARLTANRKGGWRGLGTPEAIEGNRAAVYGEIQ